jgi:hypothetical protein
MQFIVCIQIKVIRHGGEERYLLEGKTKFIKKIFNF